MGSKAGRGLTEEPAPYDVAFDDGLKDTARDIEAVLLGKVAIIDWHENYDVQREMRQGVKRILRNGDRYGEDELDKLAGQVVEVARRRLS